MMTLTASIGSVNPAMGSGGTWSWSLLNPDGPVTETVTITANDGRGGIATTSFGLNVNHVGATFTLGGDSLADPQETYYLMVENFANPGPDTVRGWTVNWGDGITTEHAGNPSFFTHVYEAGDERDFTITATATDEDGQYSGTKTVHRTPVTLTKKPQDEETTTIRRSPGEQATITVVVTNRKGKPISGWTFEPLPVLPGGWTGIDAHLEPTDANGESTITLQVAPNAPPSTNTLEIVSVKDPTKRVTITLIVE